MRFHSLTRPSEYKKPLGSERSVYAEVGILPLKSYLGFSTHPCAALTRRSNLCELETCVIDLLTSNLLNVSCKLSVEMRMVLLYKVPLS